MKITEAQIFLTRNCNLSCGYCNLVGKPLKELDFEGWQRVFRNMAALGIRTVKILGGEPTVQAWLPDLLLHAAELGLKTALLSNSSFDEEVFRGLIGAGLWGYFASIDGLGEIRHFDRQTAGKAAGGYAMLNRLKRAGVPLLAANTVIHRNNYREIPALVKRLSAEGFYINLCTVQHNETGGREFSKPGTGRELRFFREDREELESLAAELIELRRCGVKIAVPEAYLSGIPAYGIECNWQCSEMVQLRIDADGAVMLCNEYRTVLAEKYTLAAGIENPAAWLSDLVSDWKSVRRETECSGCFWSCFIQAEENIRAGRLEFDFMFD